jgi:hypothetical protein
MTYTGYFSSAATSTIPYSRYTKSGTTTIGQGYPMSSFTNQYSRYRVSASTSTSYAEYPLSLSWIDEPRQVQRRIGSKGHLKHRGGRMGKQKPKGCCSHTRQITLNGRKMNV